MNESAVGMTHEETVEWAANLEINTLKDFVKRWGQESLESGLPAAMAVVRILQFHVMALEHTAKLERPIELKIDGLGTNIWGMVAPEATGEWLGKAFNELFSLVFRCSDGFSDRFAMETGLVFNGEIRTLESVSQKLLESQQNEEKLGRQLSMSEEAKQRLREDKQKLVNEKKAELAAKEEEIQGLQDQVQRLHEEIKRLEW